MEEPEEVSKELIQFKRYYSLNRICARTKQTLLLHLIAVKIKWIFA